MAKPRTFGATRYTLDCERVLVTLLRGLGPWKDSVFLVGGLTPRYLVRARPTDVPPHAGTQDVDIVIDLQLLTDIEAYHTLEENLHARGFERATNQKGQKLSWRWQTRTEHGALMVLELLADAPQIAGGKVQPLPTEGTISALNIPHSSIVFDLYQVTEIRAELLGGGGVATEGGERAGGRWRREFARHLRALGVPANATDRAVRGENRAPKLDGIYRAEQRGESWRAQARAEEVDRELLTGGLRAEASKEALIKTRKEVERGWSAVRKILAAQGQPNLAMEVRRFVGRMPPSRSDREMLAEQLRNRHQDARTREGLGRWLGSSAERAKYPSQRNRLISIRCC